MGDEPEILLVDRRTWLLGGAATLALAACGQPHSETVAASDHQAFFLWPGVSPPEWLNHAREVYVLAGEVRHQKDSAFVPLLAVPHVKGPELWMVVRVERLDWTDAIYAAVLHVLALWTAAGNRVLGLQIDFDSATRGLDRYAAFLGDLRRRLPRSYRLSITGLLDWSAGGDPAALARLADSVDDLVVQTYQDRRTIPGYEPYIAALRRIGIPYRLGLVEGGVWREPSGVSDDPNFRGYVVFLLGS